MTQMHWVLKIVINLQKQVITCRGYARIWSPQGFPIKPKTLATISDFEENPTSLTTQIMQNIENALGIEYSYHFSPTSDNLHGHPGVPRAQTSPEISIFFFFKKPH